MTYSQEWSAAYENRTAKTGYSADLRLLLHDMSKLVKNMPALELGCGVAANYPSFKDYEFLYHGIDGSPVAIETARAAYPELDGRLACADFTTIRFAPNYFAIVTDRAAVSHNDRSAIKRCVQHIHDCLPVNGIFIGIDWFNKKHSEFTRGKMVDEHTRTGYEEGQFANVGRVHFSSQSDLEDIFSRFEIVMLRERTTVLPSGYPTKAVNFPFVSKAFAGQDYVSSVWDIIATKKK